MTHFQIQLSEKFYISKFRIPIYVAKFTYIYILFAHDKTSAICTLYMHGVNIDVAAGGLLQPQQVKRERPVSPPIYPPDATAGALNPPGGIHWRYISKVAWYNPLLRRYIIIQKKSMTKEIKTHIFTCPTTKQNNKQKNKLNHHQRTKQKHTHTPQALESKSRANVAPLAVSIKRAVPRGEAVRT